MCGGYPEGEEMISQALQQMIQQQGLAPGGSMSNGQALYEGFRAAYRTVTLAELGLWTYRTPDVQSAWAEFATQLGATNPTAGSSVQFDLKALLKRYGRHNPRCATGFDCSCGWAEVEKLVGL